MENRNGLCAAFTLHNPIAEKRAGRGPAKDRRLSGAVSRRADQDARGGQGLSPERFCGKAAGNGRSRRIVACKDQVQVAGLDGRTTTQRSYQVSLKIRKRVEEIFGLDPRRWADSDGAGIGDWSATQAWGYSWRGLTTCCEMARLAAA